MFKVFLRTCAPSSDYPALCGNGVWVNILHSASPDRHWVLL